MGRKERCPQCGSKKITITANLKKCTICKYEWAGKTKKEKQLKVHIDKALKADISKDEILEVCLHILVYAGFPASWNSLAVTQEVFAKQV